MSLTARTEKERQAVKKPFKKTKREDEYSRTVFYAVRGFWSGDNVSACQRRSRKNDEWEPPSIRWSSGGRDKALEKDDIVAAECFGKAIADACAVAREWSETAAKVALP